MEWSRMQEIIAKEVESCLTEDHYINFPEDRRDHANWVAGECVKNIREELGRTTKVVGERGRVLDKWDGTKVC